MPERIQRVSEIAQGAQTATYVSGATSVGIGVASRADEFSTMLWLHENAWLISMCCMVLTFVVMLVFRALEYRLKVKADKRAELDFNRRRTDLLYKSKTEKPDID